MGLFGARENATRDRGVTRSGPEDGAARTQRAVDDKIGATPVGSSSKDFDAYMHAEATKWEPLLKAANIRAQ